MVSKSTRGGKETLLNQPLTPASVMYTKYKAKNRSTVKNAYERFVDAVCLRTNEQINTNGKGITTKNKMEIHWGKSYWMSAFIFDQIILF